MGNVPFINVDKFQPALPMRGVTAFAVVLLGHVLISTRTPHAGSDRTRVWAWAACTLFQPALPMRGVTAGKRYMAKLKIFQPALPMRGVTFDDAQ